MVVAGRAICHYMHLMVIVGLQFNFSQIVKRIVKQVNVTDDMEWRAVVKQYSLACSFRNINAILQL